MPLGYLKDQAAVNRIISRQSPGVACYGRNGVEKYSLGYLRLCLSRMDKKRSGAKTECMMSMKKEVASWDADGKI